MDNQDAYDAGVKKGKLLNNEDSYDAGVRKGKLLKKEEWMENNTKVQESIKAHLAKLDNHKPQNLAEEELMKNITEDLEHRMAAMLKEKSDAEKCRDYEEAKAQKKYVYDKGFEEGKARAEYLQRDEEIYKKGFTAGELKGVWKAVNPVGRKYVFDLGFKAGQKHAEYLVKEEAEALQKEEDK